jgi:hypothetical protein
MRPQTTVGKFYPVIFEYTLKCEKIYHSKFPFKQCLHVAYPRLLWYYLTGNSLNPWIRNNHLKTFKQSPIVVVLSLMVVFGLLLSPWAAAARSDFAPSGRITSKLLQQYPLSYVKVVEDAAGNPILEIAFEYIGREPEGEFWLEEESSLRGRRPTYYHVTYRNLTNDPVMFKNARVHWLISRKSTEYYAKADGHKGKREVFAENVIDYTEKPKFRDDLTNRLGPRQTKTNANTFVYSTRGDIYLAEVTFIHRGREQSYCIHMVALSAGEDRSR